MPEFEVKCVECGTAIEADFSRGYGKEVFLEVGRCARCRDEEARARDDEDADAE
jgi:hypothetical protein